VKSSTGRELAKFVAGLILVAFCLIVSVLVVGLVLIRITVPHQEEDMGFPFVVLALGIIVGLPFSMGVIWSIGKLANRLKQAG
jgi:hypothetical protein